MLGRVAALIVVAYQRVVSPFIRPRCRFYPSCSAYAVQAFRTNGLVIGLFQSVWRLLRCGPWTGGGVDHPKKIELLHRAESRRETKVG